jgi:hypothetical protein
MADCIILGNSSSQQLSIDGSQSSTWSRVNINLAYHTSVIEIGATSKQSQPYTLIVEDSKWAIISNRSTISLLQSTTLVSLPLSM